MDGCVIDIDHRHPLAPGTEVGGYRIERQLGTGGFALTYRARSADGGDQVVIKEYAPLDVAERAADGITLGPISSSETTAWRQALTAFVTEAQTLAALRHPSILPVIRFFRENGTAYLVTPFVAGKSLYDLIDRTENGDGGDSMDGVSQESLTAIAEQLLGALDEMHRRGILHRDIKPDNVLVDRLADGSLKAVLIDFGSARITDAGRRDPMRGFGSPGYAAPEQYDARELQGPWTDLYGLAALLYHGVTGNAPPPADDRKRGTTMEPAAGAGILRYPHDFLRAIDDALDLDPALRPRSVADFRASMAGNRNRSLLRRARAKTPMLRDWRVAAAVLAGVAVVAAWAWLSGSDGPAPGPRASIPKAFKPGDRFRDCDDCPFMTVIPERAFPAGTRPELLNRFSSIKRPFAVSIHEVTRAEFAAFVAASKHRMEGGCRTQVKDGVWRSDPKANWRAPGMAQTPLHPVVCVSWDDARAYVRWLSSRTGKPYRLPTAAEWEFAARAGSRTAFAWGPAVAEDKCQGCRTAPPTRSTAPIGAYTANRFGLHDMHGNAAEWVQDCAAPATVTPTTSCRKRAVKGGHWAAAASDLKLTATATAFPDLRNNRTGFRIVRDIP